jgi:hypothetical protein
MRTFNPLRLALSCLVFGVFLAAATVAADRELAPSAVQQIELLLQEKENRTSTERKIHSNLLHAIRRHNGQAEYLNRLPLYEVPYYEEEDQRVTVDIRANVNEGLLERIVDLDGKVVNAHAKYSAIRARLPLNAMLNLAEEIDVAAIYPADRMMVQKMGGTRNTTEGDIAHGADTVRAQFGVDGTGISVAAMSDSVEALSDLINSGDLPNDVTVLPDQAGTGTSEGTALLEIIFDMAPGADLFFATAQGGEAQFAQNIFDLFTAGNRVIVDDVLYFAEPVFQDGPVAQMVDFVSDQGVLYFTSAGNSGNLNSGTSGVFEGLYDPIAPSGVLIKLVDSVHNFNGQGAGNEVTQDSPFFFTLQWNDSYFAPTNDFDLFLMDSTLENIVASSTDDQGQIPRAFEIIDSTQRDDTGNQLVVGLKGAIGKVGDQQTTIHVNANRGRLAQNTDGQIFGHPGANGAITVGAVDHFSSNGGPFTGGSANPIETFSSDGPRTIFFDASGQPLTQPEVRQKPDVSAADGVSTNTPGFNPFFGTSASAPHSAAIAALFKEAFPNIPSTSARDIFQSSALDIEDPGFDRDSGNGIMMADRSLETPIFADGFESGDASAWTK